MKRLHQLANVADVLDAALSHLAEEISCEEFWRVVFSASIGFWVYLLTLGHSASVDEP